MTENIQSKLSNRQGSILLIIGILVFGSIWGFLEATLGGFLPLIIFPNKGAIMAGIGVALMSSALAIYRKPAMLPGIGIVAAAFKLLDVWLFALPVASIHIINPAMAIIFEALAFGAIAAVFTKSVRKSVPARIGVGVLAGIISAVAWVYFAIYVMDAPSYARVVFTAGGFIAGSGVVQAIFFGVFLPLGYLAGEKLAARTVPAINGRGVLHYATSAAVVVFCWGISTVAMIAGL